MKLKLFKGLAIITLFLALPLAMTSSAVAADCNSTNLTAQQAIQCGACGAAGQPTCGTPAEEGAQAAASATKTVTNILNTLSLVIGIVAVVMIMVGGFRYITSNGKQESVSAAKNTLLYAVIGLVVVALAQAIVHFVINKSAST